MSDFEGFEKPEYQGNCAGPSLQPTDGDQALGPRHFHPKTHMCWRKAHLHLRSVFKLLTQTCTANLTPTRHGITEDSLPTPTPDEMRRHQQTLGRDLGALLDRTGGAGPNRCRQEDLLGSLAFESSWLCRRVIGRVRKRSRAQEVLGESGQIWLFLD